MNSKLTVHIFQNTIIKNIKTGGATSKKKTIITTSNDRSSR
jgi:hypothetical protein